MINSFWPRNTNITTNFEFHVPILYKCTESFLYAMYTVVQIYCYLMYLHNLYLPICFFHFFAWNYVRFQRLYPKRTCTVLVQCTASWQPKESDFRRQLPDVVVSKSKGQNDPFVSVIRVHILATRGLFDVVFVFIVISTKLQGDGFNLALRMSEMFNKAQ